LTAAIRVRRWNIGGANFVSDEGVVEKEVGEMKMEKWWTVDTIFVTVVGAAMAVVLSASVFSRPHISMKGSSLVPASVLRDVRNQQQECETMQNDLDRSMHAHTHC
jgi:hypothetical protein